MIDFFPSIPSSPGDRPISSHLSEGITGRSIMLHVNAGTLTFREHHVVAVLEVLEAALKRLRDPAPLPKPEPKLPSTPQPSARRDRISLDQALEF